MSTSLPEGATVITSVLTGDGAITFLIWTTVFGGTLIGDTITLISTASTTTLTDESTTTTTTTTRTITHESTHETSETSADPTSPVTVTVFSPLPTETNISNGGDGLSSGAKAGIGVGVTLGFLLIAAIGAIFWFWRRKRRRKDALREPPVIMQNASSVRVPPFEMDSMERQVFELPEKEKAERSVSGNNQYELDT